MEWTSRQRQVHCLQIPHHAASRTDLPKFLKDQSDARLYFFIGTEDHFSAKLANSPHRQPLAQFSPFGLMSCSSMHALLEMMEFRLAHHPCQSQQ